MSIVSLANPLLFGLYNVLTPKSILTWKHGGGVGLWRQAIKDMALLGALMGSVFIAVLFVGENVMSLLYPGNEYQGHARLISVLAFATVVSALALPAANGLAAMERPRPSAAVAIGSAVIHVVLVWWMMTEWGLLGAAYAVLAARIVGTLGRWIVFLMLVRKLSDGAPMQQRACAVL
jgi:O-antigen/teichoic acid export membrane protein